MNVESFLKGPNGWICCKCKTINDNNLPRCYFCGHSKLFCFKCKRSKKIG